MILARVEREPMTEKIVVKPDSYIKKLMAGTIDREALYKQQDALLSLYKHHLKVLLEANVFIYAVTGTIASFVITHSTSPYGRWILWLPAIVCILFAVFFFIVSTGFNYTDQELGAICAALNIETFPRIQALPIALRVSGVLLCLIGALLIVGFFFFPGSGCLPDAV
jgi:hypothetical protein